MNEVQVEATGETVGEAKWHALRELERLRPGLDKASVRFQVVSEGERGLLGVGYVPARVIATADAGEPAAPAVSDDAGEDSPAAAEVRRLVERVVEALGLSCAVLVAEDDEAIRATCSGGELGLLIGRRGQTIDAVQYLLNAVLLRSGLDGKEVILDAAGYRARRNASLEATAARAAQRARASGEPVALDPMTAAERKVVHTSLKDEAGIETSSEGTEPNRYVVVTPAGAAD